MILSFCLWQNDEKRIIGVAPHSAQRGFLNEPVLPRKNGSIITVVPVVPAHAQ